MNYSLMDECLQALFATYVPLSPAQRSRLSQFCASQILAGSSQLPKLATWLKREAKQDNREQWLRRLLEAAFVRQEYVYEPWLKQALKGYGAKTWHLVIDRSNFLEERMDLALVALAYAKRAIPLKWQEIPYGGTKIQVYIELLKAAQTLVPQGTSVILHGDAEFGAMPLLDFARQQNWHYILGQRAHYQVRPFAQSAWKALEDYPMSKSRGLYLEKLVLTKEHEYSCANVFGFFQKGKTGELEKRFYASSLPITASLRRLGKRRWAIEPCFQDFKSSGWQLDKSELEDCLAREGLRVLLACSYLWLTCLGRWLCKTGQRHLVDGNPVRQLSFFRIGWDWLVYQFRSGQAIPHLLTLYS